MDWEPVAVIEGGVVYYVRADHIGRPAFATDVTEAVVWSASYLPFGEVRVSTGALPPMRFPGQWFQSESGLHQNWMRDYDPTTGRYLQPDPLGLIDGPSVYGYADQNPGRWVDPTGEFIPVLVGILFGIVLDEVVERIEEDCSCGGSVDIDKYTIIGGFFGATGPFEKKHRMGISGGGRSGTRTSLWSSTFGSTKGWGRYARKTGRVVGRVAPIAGGAIALYDIYRLRNCF